MSLVPGGVLSRLPHPASVRRVGARVVALLPPRQTLAEDLPGAAYLWFKRLFVYSSLWVAGSLASIALFTCHVIGVDSLAPAALVLASGLFIYNLDHVADARVQVVPDAEAQQYFKHPAVLVLLVLSAITTGLLVSEAPRAAQWAFAAYCGVGFFYGLPVIPLPTRAGVRWARLKEIPWFKGWLVASAITTGTVVMPLGWAGVPIGVEYVPLLAFVFVFSATNTHMFDVRDLVSDRDCGVRTLPVAMGVRSTKLALVLLNLVLLGAVLTEWSDSLLGAHPEVGVSLCISVLYVLLLRVRTARDVYAIFIDGCWYLPALLLYLPHSP